MCVRGVPRAALESLGEQVAGPAAVGVRGGLQRRLEGQQQRARHALPERILGHDDKHKHKNKPQKKKEEVEDDER